MQFKGTKRFIYLLCIIIRAARRKTAKGTLSLSEKETFSTRYISDTRNFYYLTPDMDHIKTPL